MPSDPTSWLKDSSPFIAPYTFLAEILMVGASTVSVYETFVSRDRLVSSVCSVTSSPVMGAVAFALRPPAAARVSPPRLKDANAEEDDADSPIARA